MERGWNEAERRLCGSTPMEKENVENGLERRGEECDLGCIDRKKRDDGVDDVDDDDDDDGDDEDDDGEDEEERGCKRSWRGEGKEGNLSRVECNGGAGFG
ncbi:hypothetical protein K0M31_007723 [Melipona bicolor]|uniref:Uncharacterized protein n=1 Tax=Melipona bicolor TaxID=60889 RepID=A0AA40KVX0_9HYME|nr:hypothetical protein K0M31_007723 [Melipona bicolor]